MNTFTQEEFKKLTQLQRDFQKRLQAEINPSLVIEIPQVEHIVNGQMVREYVCGVKLKGQKQFIQAFAIYKDEFGGINAVNYL